MSASIYTSIRAYKGFDIDFTCRGFQYEAGKQYEHKGEVKACISGFHACEHPLEVFCYYAPATSRFAEVTLSGELSRDSEGSKIAASRIMIEEELSLHEMIKRAVEYVFARAEPPQNTAEGDCGTASATGDCGTATATGGCGTATATGDYGAASATGPHAAASATGGCGAASATGYCGAAIATGYCGAALATGYGGAASATGNNGAASTSGHGGAATATGANGAALATGHGGAATATGYDSAATATGYGGTATAAGSNGAASVTGEQGAAIATGLCGAASATGLCGAAIATGRHGRASGEVGCALFLVERADNGKVVNVWAGIVGRDGIKPNTYYMLRDGKPVEVDD